MSQGNRPRHPLPQSGEARHDEIPETLEREKGVGEDAERIVQPSSEPVTPEGKTYGDMPPQP
jgi:hypothetical protein